ncbi:MAG: phage terminase large subunit [Alphaproteobacteria bacterium]|nr:phage terminase large subunit [Alphaproteobacteria bacterium]
MTDAIGFPLFLTLWNRRQKQKTLRVHLRIARWLAARWDAGDRRMLLMAFRSCGKSTITGLFAAWLLWRNPALRILVMAADGALAAKMVRNTKRIIERHPLTQQLRPDKPDQWAADRFTVRRKAEWRDPSMLAFGIGANITGSRADVIICDDVEVPNTSDSREKRENLRERLAELAFVLVTGGAQLYVGTPHTAETIYSDDYLSGYKALRVPLVGKGGVIACPERYSITDVEALKRTSGPRKFAAQMMLQAQPIEDGRLQVSALQWYADEIVYTEANGQPNLHVAGRRMLACSAWWDPAFGHGGDGSVVAVVYTDGAGEYWLHKLVYLKTSAGMQEDEATQQCRAIAALCRQYHVPSVTIEINGIGRFLPAILRREVAGRVAVVEASSRKAKDIRILEGFDAVLAAKALHVHESIRQTPFPDEMRDWKPQQSGKHDDGLDAVAGALLQAPVRVGASPKGVRPRSWHGHGMHTAKTNFNVME